MLEMKEAGEMYKKQQRDVQEATERCEMDMNERDKQLRRYENQLKEVQERMKRSERINRERCKKQ
jgi:prefoldin subunit 5